MFIYLLFTFVISKHCHVSLRNHHIATHCRSRLHPCGVIRSYGLGCSLGDKWFEDVEIQAYATHHITTNGVEVIDKVVYKDPGKVYHPATLRIGILHARTYHRGYTKQTLLSSLIASLDK